jgi:uncharacterized protein (TIGR02145 family)
MTPITIATTGVTGILQQNLPEGLEATWSANVITISGIPTQATLWNYLIVLEVSCGNPLGVEGTITVSACTPNTAGEKLEVAGVFVGSKFQEEITTTGATGIGIPTGLPDGLTATWSNNKITISGTPTESGTFTYFIPLTGGCGEVNATGTFYVNPCTPNTAGTPSSPTVTVNSLMTPIKIATTGATGIFNQIIPGLPPGVTATWSANEITISGTPTESGTFTYFISLTGGCGEVNATGTITVTPSTVPDAPTNVVATAGDGSASVAFEAPSNNGGSDISAYYVEFTPSPPNPFGGPGATSPITVTGLTNGTEYTFTVVAINGVGASIESAPSNAVTPVAAASACPTPTVEDIDNNIYNTVSIGNQCWTKENLRVSRYNDGTLISVVTDDTEWSQPLRGIRSWYNNDSTANEIPYGNLYNWYAVQGRDVSLSLDLPIPYIFKNICPSGWHVPTDSDWNKLVKSLDSDADTSANSGVQSSKVSLKMKSTGTEYWSTEFTGTNNSSSFSALPGGFRSGSGGSFYDVRTTALFWSVSMFDGGNAWGRQLDRNDGVVYRGSNNLSAGASVRCLRD